MFRPCQKVQTIADESRLCMRGRDSRRYGSQNHVTEILSRIPPFRHRQDWYEKLKNKFSDLFEIETSRFEISQFMLQRCTIVKLCVNADCTCDDCLLTAFNCADLCNWRHASVQVGLLVLMILRIRIWSLCCWTHHHSQTLYFFFRIRFVLLMRDSLDR